MLKCDLLIFNSKKFMVHLESVKRYCCFFLFQWAVDEDPPGFNRPDKLTFGLQLNGEFFSSVLDKGPLADSQEVHLILKHFYSSYICSKIKLIL